MIYKYSTRTQNGSKLNSLEDVFVKPGFVIYTRVQFLRTYENIPIFIKLAGSISSYFEPMKHLPMKKLSADETLTANERLSETSQNLSLAITLSLAVAKTVGMLNCSPNSLHSDNERI